VHLGGHVLGRTDDLAQGLPRVKNVDTPKSTSFLSAPGACVWRSMFSGLTSPVHDPQAVAVQQSLHQRPAQPGGVRLPQGPVLVHKIR